MRVTTTLLSFLSLTSLSAYATPIRKPEVDHHHKVSVRQQAYTQVISPSLSVTSELYADLLYVQFALAFSQFRMAVW